MHGYFIQICPIGQTWRYYGMDIELKQKHLAVLALHKTWLLQKQNVATGKMSQAVATFNLFLLL